MKRSEILERYDVRNGIIRSPGKFENEAIYMPRFYEAMLNGMSEMTDDDCDIVDVADEDRAEFPELGDKTCVKFYVDDQGFVNEV